MTHAELVEKAVAWLRRQGYTTIVTDRSIMDDEQPDAIGWKATGFSCVVECKVSRRDFLKDQKKPWRKHPAEGMGHARYYLTPPGLVEVAEVPMGWGLLATAGRGVAVLAEPVHCHVERNLRAEIKKLLSLARRLEGKVRPMRKPGQGPTNKAVYRTDTRPTYVPDRGGVSQGGSVPDVWPEKHVQAVELAAVDDPAPGQ